MFSQTKQLIEKKKRLCVALIYSSTTMTFTSWPGCAFFFFSLLLYAFDNDDDITFWKWNIFFFFIPKPLNTNLSWKTWLDFLLTNLKQWCILIWCSSFLQFSIKIHFQTFDPEMGCFSPELSLSNPPQRLFATSVEKICANFVPFNSFVDFSVILIAAFLSKQRLLLVFLIKLNDREAGISGFTLLLPSHRLPWQ